MLLPPTWCQSACRHTPGWTISPSFPASPLTKANMCTFSTLWKLLLFCLIAANFKNFPLVYHMRLLNAVRWLLRSQRSPDSPKPEHLFQPIIMHSYYLPIWFQAVKGDNAIQSGHNMLANALFGLAAGIFVSTNGLFAPPAIIGCAISTIGTGFICTLQVNASAAKWMGLEILTSAGLGLAVQQGFSAVQTALPLKEVPIGTAAVVASQSLGGAIFVSIGNTLLQDYLLAANNNHLVPGVNVRLVIMKGATAF